MTAARPWYKRYAQDFIMGTIGLDLELRGAYSILIDMLNDRGRPIPDDAAYISGVMGISKRKWSALRKRLIEAQKIIELEGGFLTNKRFENDRKKYAEMVAAKTEAGRKGGLSRPKTSRKPRENVAKTSRASEVQATGTSENNDLTQASAGVYQSPESRSKSSKKDSTVLAADFEAFWLAFPKGRKNKKPKAQTKFKSLVKSRVISAEKLIEAAAKYRDQVGDEFQYVPMPVSWLNDEGWKNEDAAGPVGGQHGANGAGDGNRRSRIAGAFDRRLAAEDRPTVQHPGRSDASGDGKPEGAK